MTERLGLPRDLHERELPIVRLEGLWLRLHAAERDPAQREDVESELREVHRVVVSVDAEDSAHVRREWLR